VRQLRKAERSRRVLDPRPPPPNSLPLQPLPSLPIPLPPRIPPLHPRKKSQTLRSHNRSNRQQIPNVTTLPQHNMRRQHINLPRRIPLLPLAPRRINRLHIIAPAMQPASSLHLHPHQPPSPSRPNHKVKLLAISPGHRQPKSQTLRLQQKRRLRPLPHPLRIPIPLLPPPEIRLRKNPRNESRNCVFIPTPMHRHRQPPSPRPRTTSHPRGADTIFHQYFQYSPPVNQSPGHPANYFRRFSTRGTEACAKTKEDAPSFASFAKGGNHGRLQPRF